MGARAAARRPCLGRRARRRPPSPRRGQRDGSWSPPPWTGELRPVSQPSTRDDAHRSPPCCVLDHSKSQGDSFGSASLPGGVAGRPFEPTVTGRTPRPAYPRSERPNPGRSSTVRRMGDAWGMACAGAGGVSGWIAEQAAEITARAERELEALVAVSSPSGDVHGAEECISVAGALAPAAAASERLPCSSPATPTTSSCASPGTGARPDPAARPPRHGRRPRGPPAAAARAGPARRLGRRRHEGRRRRRARRPARARAAAAATSPRWRCCSSATRSGAPRRSPTSSASRAGTRACASRPAS